MPTIITVTESTKSASPIMKSVLVIDDHDEFRQLACDILLDAGFDVWDAPCPAEAFKELDKETFDLIICDLQMPFTMGEEQANYPFSFEVGIRTIQELSAVFPFTPIIAVSALPPTVLEQLRERIQTVPILGKPFHSSDLMSLIEKCFDTPWVREVQ